MPASEKPWVVLYHARGTWPLRRSSWEDLRSWGHHVGAPVVYINTAFGLRLSDLSALHPSRIILDTTFLKLRWGDPAVLSDTDLRSTLANINAVKILRPQDEFVDTDTIDDLASDINAALILSCAPPSEHKRLYPRAKAGGTQIRQVMTGYIDEGLRRAFRSKAVPLAGRPIDLGYRAWRATPWLGRHAKLKVDVAAAALRSPVTEFLNTEISLNASDVVSGGAWLDLLQRCKAVLGVEGGASIHDPDGHLRQKGLAFLDTHSGATFEQVEAACFPERDLDFDLRCLSPRHLEAAAVGTCQFLVQGNYNGALEPNVHYIPISKDLLDIDSALSAFDDIGKMQDIADRAREHVLSNPNLSYKSFVENVGRWTCDDTGDEAGSAVPTKAYVTKLQRRDQFEWSRVKFEVWLGRHPNLRRLLSPVRRMFSKSPR